MSTRAANGAGSSGAASGAKRIAFADMAGKWAIRAVPESGTDTSTMTYTLVATRDSTGWSVMYKSGLTVPMRASVSGDSVMTSTGPHQSQRRKNVQVATTSTYRMHGDTLVGRSTAHYTTKGADSVLVVRVIGTRTS